MAKDIQNRIDVRGDYQIKRGAVKNESGLHVQKLAKAIFDTSKNDSAGVSNKTVAAHGLGVFLPAKAVITRAWIQTITGFTSAASTATIALKLEAAGDLFAALAVSDAKLSGAGFTTGIPDVTTANFKQATVERELTATVAVQALTAGKLMIVCEYNVAE